MRVYEFIFEKMVERNPRIAFNPSRAEYLSIFDNVRHEDEYAIRAILDPSSQDVYLWDAYDAPHGAIKDRYDLPTAFHLMIKDKHIKVLTLWRYERYGLDRDTVFNLVRNNTCLNRIFPHGFSVSIED